MPCEEGRIKQEKVEWLDLDFERENKLKFSVK